MELRAQYQETKSRNDFFESFTKNHYEATSSAAKYFDASPLEDIIGQYSSNKDLPNDVSKQIVKHLYQLADYIGLTKKAIRSDNLKKLDRHKNTIEDAIKETGNQIQNVDNRLNMLSAHIRKLDDQLHNDVVHYGRCKSVYESSEQKLKNHLESNAPKTPVSDVNSYVYLDDYEAAKHEFESIAGTIECQRNIRDSFVADRFYERVSLSVLKSDRLVLNALHKQLEYYIKRHEQKPIFSTLSKAKLGIGTTYNLENELIDKENREKKRYHDALERTTPIKDMQSNVIARKKQRNNAGVVWPPRN